MLIGFLASCSSKKTVSSHKRVNNVYVDADEAQDANKPIEASKKQNKKTSGFKRKNDWYSRIFFHLAHLDQRNAAG